MIIMWVKEMKEEGMGCYEGHGKEEVQEEGRRVKDNSVTGNEGDKEARSDGGKQE